MEKISLEKLFTEAEVKIGDKFYSPIFGDLYYDGMGYAPCTSDRQFYFKKEPITDNPLQAFTKTIIYEDDGKAYTVKYNGNSEFKMTDDVTIFPYKGEDDWKHWAFRSWFVKFNLKNGLI